MLSSNLNQHTIASSAALYITGSSQNTGQANSLRLRVEQLVRRVGLHSPIYNTVRRAVGLLLLRLNNIMYLSVVNIIQFALTITF